MNEFFKDKKVVVTGYKGWKYEWITELLREWEADIINSENDIEKVFAQGQPEILFHISTHKEEADSIVSPYLSTSQILDAVRTSSSIKSAILIPENKSDKEWSKSLTLEEKKDLADLLKKVSNVEIRGEIWHQLVHKFITIPIELCILNDRNEVFLVYRKDREFDGYHMPGTVLNDWEDVSKARSRLVLGEVMTGAGISITEPQSIGWFEITRGTKAHEDPHRHEISLLHVAYITNEFIPRDGMGFYSFEELPENILGHHKYLLQFFKRYLEDGKIIVGK